MKLVVKCKEYAIKCHKDTNHLYDGKPYEYHLTLTVNNALKFIDLVPNSQIENILSACWLHDVIEDCRQTYNDIKQISNITVAELVRACTNYTGGRNRRERMPEFIYENLRQTPYAIFVKLCDRLANVQHSVITQSSMLKKYRDEQRHFEHELRYYTLDKQYEPMFIELNRLLFKDYYKPQINDETNQERRTSSSETREDSN